MNTQAALTRMLNHGTFTPVAITRPTQPDFTNTNTGRNKQATRSFVGDVMHVLK